MTKENNSLGKFHLKGIPPMPRDAFEIEVDANGTLNASTQDKSGVVSNQINISMRRDVCLRTQCERVKHTLFPFSRAAIEIDSFFGALICFSCCRKHSLRSRTRNV